MTGHQTTNMGSEQSDPSVIKLVVVGSGSRDQPSWPSHIHYQIASENLEPELRTENRYLMSFIASIVP